MTIGIYLLKFKGTTKVYIGQSISIERRYSTHLNKLKKQTHTTKLNSAYIKYGEPLLEILVSCKVEDLDTLEDYYIDLYNSFNDGFNTVKEAQAFPILLGENNPFAKYSNDSIINVLMCLIKYPEATIIEISEATKVHKSTVKNIHNGYSHKWLEKDYPTEYALLINRRANLLPINTSKQKGITRPDIVSPLGEVFSGITNIAQFAREHGLNQGALTSVFNHKALSHKGWKLK
jgi:group I intron endonuclease